MAIHFPTNICSKPFTIEDLNIVRKTIKDNPQLHRNQLAELLCNKFGWVSESGKLKKMSCKAAMLKLWRKKLIELPPARRPNTNGRRFKITSVSDPRFPIEQRITELQDIEIVLIKTSEESRLWNELIERYHYLRFKPLPGAQLRYLIYSRQGLLGAISFSASAWKIAPRDKWIGWDHPTREKKLHLIVNNSRYLILPWVRVKHLASKVLSMCVKRIRNDWKERYNYEPVLLETFVEKDRFKGTCYKAANWICVGQTQGRGKKDVHSEYKLPIKDIWMYPLVKDFRQDLTNGAR